MVDLDLYRTDHKPVLIRLVRHHGLRDMEFIASVYAATHGCKLLACFFYLAEEFGYATLIQASQEKTILDRIEGTIHFYGYVEVRGVLPELAPDCLNSFAKIIYKK